MRFIKVLIIILLFFFAMMFFVQNYEVLSQTMPLKLNVYLRDWKSIPLPFYLLILVSFLLGALFTLFYFVLERLRLASELRSCRSRLGRLEKELTSLRNLPLEKGDLSKDLAPSREETPPRNAKPEKRAAEPAPAPAPAPEASFNADFLNVSPGRTLQADAAEDEGAGEPEKT